MAMWIVNRIAGVSGDPGSSMLILLTHPHGNFFSLIPHPAFFDVPNSLRTLWMEANAISLGIGDLQCSVSKREVDFRRARGKEAGGWPSLDLTGPGSWRLTSIP